MRRRTKANEALLITFMMAVVTAQPASAQLTVIDLGTLCGGYSWAYGINNLGQVVGDSGGDSASCDEVHAFLWSNGTMRDLGTLGGRESTAFGINDLGQVVGVSSTASGGGRPFLWSDGTMRDLGTLGGCCWSTAYGINELGHVVGGSPTASGTYHAFLWTPNTGMTDLGTLGGWGSGANSINDLGQVVGYASTASGEVHAFLWSNGTMTDLGTLGGSYSQAYAINNLGQVAGTSSTASGGWHAFLWSQDTGMADLGTLGGGSSGANGINNQEQVVGASDGRAFLWSNGGMVDLGGPPYSQAFDINDHGQVVGGGGFGRALLWTPAFPPARTALLIDDVEALVAAGSLNRGQGNSLIAKLEAALRALDRGQTKEAINVLQAFINQVGAYIKAGILSAGDGQRLLDAASDIITQLGG